MMAAIIACVIVIAAVLGVVLFTTSEASAYSQKLKLAEHADVPDGGAEAPAAEDGPGAADFTGKRLLVAEDNAINMEIAAMILTEAGFAVETAENGRIALDKVSSSRPGYYDAVLMDVQMPVMDGFEATRAIRASGREDAQTVPVIALTANAFDEDVERSMQAGLNAHLSKPVEPDILFETLETLIHP